MTIFYVTTGAWALGTGTPLSAAQVDGTFYEVDQRIEELVSAVADGTRTETVTYTYITMTFYFTDGTSQVIPLPVVQLTYVGPWMNNTLYLRGHLFTADNGF